MLNFAYPGSMIAAPTAAGAAASTWEPWVQVRRRVLKALAALRPTAPPPPAAAAQALSLAEENVAAARPELTFFRPRDWLVHAPRQGAADGAFEGAGGPAALASVSFDIASDLYLNRPLARPPQAGPPRPPVSHHEALSMLILAEKAFVRTASSNAQKRTSALQVRPGELLLLLRCWKSGRQASRLYSALVLPWPLRRPPLRTPLRRRPPWSSRCGPAWLPCACPAPPSPQTQSASAWPCRAATHTSRWSARR